jgi:UPF0716 family protein affecting phage T7 exclusion
VLLLLPPTRALIRAGLFRYLRRRAVVVGAGGFGAGPDRPPPGGQPYDFEGSAQEMPSNGAGQEESKSNGPERPRLPPS